MRSLLLPLLLLLCAAAPSLPARLQSPPSLLGLTAWGCRDTEPRSMIADEMLEPAAAPLLAVVRAHEAEHRRQMRSRGSCEAANAALRLPALAVHDEVLAFCVGARAGLASRYYRTLDEGLRDGAFNLASAYRFGLTYDAALARLRAACGPTSVGA